MDQKKGFGGKGWEKIGQPVLNIGESNLGGGSKMQFIFEKKTKKGTIKITVKLNYALIICLVLL